ncbi:MAG: hypothetical protein Q7T55_10710 [Solirubrobacteraceae bacterium]|nr:hypothetical protein [Solirubrobacteraceae bacterium]
MLRLRPVLALASLALVLPFSACGDGNDPVAEAHNEGIYVTTGGLRYQVQMSRKLNPYDIEDRDYLNGVPNAAGQVANQKVAWYGVFLRVENRTHKGDGPEKTILAASKFKIIDNKGTEAEPTDLPESNVYAYRSVPLNAKGQIPAASSTAGQSPIGGALVLFKVDQGILERRPTKLIIEAADGSSEAEVSLDV